MYGGGADDHLLGDRRRRSDGHRCRRAQQRRRDLVGLPRWAGRRWTRRACSSARRASGRSPAVGSSSGETGNVAGSAMTARWAEPGGVVLSATTAGSDPSTVERKLTELVGSMRKLDRDQWTDLTEQFSYCGALTTLGRSETSGGSSSGTVEVSPTSTTIPVPDVRDDDPDDGDRDRSVAT